MRHRWSHMRSRFPVAIRRVPVLLALLVLIAVYLLRWSVLEPPLVGAIERAVYQASGIEIEIGEISGNLFREVRMADVRVVGAPLDGALRSLSVDEVVVRYRLGELLPFLALMDLPLLSFSSRRLDLAWIERAGLNPVSLVSHLHRTIPESLSISVAGEASFNTPERPSASGFELRVSGGAAAGVPVATVALTRITSPWWPGGARDSLALDITVLPDRILLRTDPERTSDGISIEGSLRGSGGDDAILMYADVAVSVGELRARGEADAQSATLAVTLPGDDDATALVERAVAQPRLRTGSLEFDATLRALPDTAYTDGRRSVVHDLLFHPDFLPDDANLSVVVDAAAWRFDPVDLDRLSGSAEWLHGTLTVGPTTVVGRIEGLDLTVAEGDSSDLEVDLAGAIWDSTTGELSVADALLRGGSAELRVDGRVKLPPDGSLIDQVRGDIEGSLTITEPDLAVEVLVRLGLIPELPDGFSPGSGIVVDFRLEGDVAEPHIAVDARVEQPALPGFPLDMVVAAASITARSITLDRLELRRGGSVVVATGSAQRDGLSVTEYRLAVESPQLVEFIPAVREASLAVSGDLQSILIESAVIELETPQGVGLVLADPFTVGWAESGVTVGRFEIQSDAVVLTGSGAYRDGQISAAIEGNGIPLAFLIGLANPGLADQAHGTVSVRARADGTVDAPSIRAVLEGQSLSFDGVPVEASMQIVQEAGRTTIEELVVDFPGIAMIEGSGFAPVAVGSGGLAVGDLSLARLRIDGELRGALGYFLPAVTERWPQAAVSFGAELTATAARLHVQASGFEQGEEPVIAGIRNLTDLIFVATVVDLQSATPEVIGELTSGDVTLATIEGSIGPGYDLEQLRVRADVRLPLLELSHLVPGVDFAGGLVLGSLQMSGGPDGIESSGRLVIENATVKVAPAIPAIARISGSISYEDRVFRTEELSGEIGPGRVTLDGAVSLDPDAETPIQLRVSSRDALLTRTPDMELRANADVRLIGSLDSAVVLGRLQVTDFHYTRSVELFSSGGAASSTPGTIEIPGVDREWARAVLLDLRVTADRTLRIQNNLFDGALSADLTIGGNAAVPRPAGRIFAAEGSVRLPAATLSVQQLEFTFPADAASPPQIALVANTSVRGYDMNVTVDGRIPDVEVRIATSPALPTDEALVLLVTGRRPHELPFVTDLAGTVTAVGSIVGRTLLGELSEHLSDEGQEFLDRLSFQIERDRGTGGIGTVEVEYELGDSEQWHLLFSRRPDDRFALQLAWRLWLR